MESLSGRGHGVRLGKGIRRRCPVHAVVAGPCLVGRREKDRLQGIVAVGSLWRLIQMLLGVIVQVEVLREVGTIAAIGAPRGIIVVKRLSGTLLCAGTGGTACLYERN